MIDYIQKTVVLSRTKDKELIDWITRNPRPISAIFRSAAYSAMIVPASHPLSPPPDAIGEEALPAQGLCCPMCGGHPVHARPGLQHVEGLNIVLACPDCGNWSAIMFVAWIELFPEIAETKEAPPNEDG